MKFVLASEHRDFFNKQHHIEFEGLISAANLNEVNSSVDNALAENLGITPARLKLQNSQKLYLAGRDLWRNSNPLRKIVLHQKLAEIASELVHLRPLRIGYDQYLQGVHHDPLSKDQNNYASLLQKPHALNQTSCLTGVACGLIICISAPKDKTENPEGIGMAQDVFPVSPGNGIYFAPDYPINYPVLRNLQGYRYLQIVYTVSMSQYFLEERDFHTHDLKHLGYVFGDKVNDKLHPFVLR